jgi:hypothetical protein
MQQHILDDRVSALAVLHDLIEVTPERVRKVGNFNSRYSVQVRGFESLLQFIYQLHRDTREIVDEIEREGVRGQIRRRSDTRA